MPHSNGRIRCGITGRAKERKKREEKKERKKKKKNKLVENRISWLFETADLAEWIGLCGIGCSGRGVDHECVVVVVQIESKYAVAVDSWRIVKREEKKENLQGAGSRV